MVLLQIGPFDPRKSQQNNRATHPDTCGQLRKTDVGTEVTLCGWVDSKRDHGGAVFIDLRDRYGVTQVVIGPPESSSDQIDEAGRVPAESVI